MYVNIIRSSVRSVVAICDDELLGKIFEEGVAQLHVRENFYAGEKKGRGDVLLIVKRMMKEDATFNVVGGESVDVLIECGALTKEGVGEVDGVKFGLVLI